MGLTEEIAEFLVRNNQSIRNKTVRRSIKKGEVADRFKEVTDLILLAQFLPGPDGRSAYQIAVQDTGFEGTAIEWIASLKGEKGNVGADGRIVVAGQATNLLSGLVDPTPETGQDLDFYINTTTDILYGPKMDGQWPPVGLVLTGKDGKSAYELAQDYGYPGDITQWLASLVGPKGDPGFSAYQVALNNGYQGTQPEWLESLRGPEGHSAYEIAVANGYAGDLPSWLISLKGLDGKSTYQLAVEGGYPGTLAEWLISIRGADGKSAYQLAMAGGFPGTEAQWLLSLKGADGKSNYQLAVDQGYPGTLEQWLLTLIGPAGKNAYELAVIAGFPGTLAEWLESLKSTVPGPPGELEEKNRDLAFTVIDAEDNVIGILTSNGVDTLELHSPSGAIFASFQEEEYEVEEVVIPELDIAYTINNPEGINLTATFKSSTGGVWGTYTEGTGFIGVEGAKPLSNEMLGVVLSSTGTGAGGVELKMDIRKDGTIFDPFKETYDTTQSGILLTKYIRPTEFNRWDFTITIASVVVVEEPAPDTPPIVIITKSLVGGSDTIKNGSASLKLFAEESHDLEGHAVSIRWIFDNPNVILTPIP